MPPRFNSVHVSSCFSIHDNIEWLTVMAVSFILHGPVHDTAITTVVPGRIYSFTNAISISAVLSWIATKNNLPISFHTSKSLLALHSVSSIVFYFPKFAFINFNHFSFSTYSSSMAFNGTFFITSYERKITSPRLSLLQLNHNVCLILWILMYWFDLPPL